MAITNQNTNTRSPARNIILSLAACLVTTTLWAQTMPTLAPTRVALSGEPKTPEAILWVGNSFFYYNNSMHNHFGQLVRASGARVRSTSATISGAGIDWHDIDSLLRPDGLGRYSFVGDNEIRFNKPGRQYDVAMMMDCSQCPVHPELKKVFHDTVKKYAATLTKAGVRPALFMSWAYKDKPEMTAALAEQYTIAANANDALVIPAGLAFGTGQHATTYGCLVALDALKRQGKVFRHIIDLGTGTGLLAFAATRLWPVAKAMASDIDPISIDVVRENAALNGVRGLQLVVADGLAHRDLVARAPFDLVIANILAQPLIDMAPMIAASVAHGGTLILAGLLDTQANAVARAYKRQGMRLVSQGPGQWPVLVMRGR